MTNPGFNPGLVILYHKRKLLFCFHIPFDYTVMLFAVLIIIDPCQKQIPLIFLQRICIVFVIPFASLKAQTSYEKCCAPPLFDL